MDKLSAGLIYADILTARQALDTYKKNPKLKNIKNICAYHLQQSVEKIIKAQIYASGFPYNDRNMYTHNIAVLIAYIEKYNIPAEIPEFIERNSHIITKWESGSRYDLHFSIRVDVLEKYLHVIESWFESMKKRLK